MQLILKIILLLVITAVSLFFAGAMIYILAIQKQNFVLEMLYGVGVSILGFLSCWFHVKTINLYKLDKQNKVLPKPSKVFWTFNIGFAAALVALFLWVFYSIITVFNQQALEIKNDEITVMILVFSIPMAISAFIIFESYYLKKLIKKNADKQLILDIDNIKGDEDA